MKTNRKLLFNALVTCCVLLLSSCSKETLQPGLAPFTMETKMERIQKFISIAWGTPLNKVIYNEKTEKFTFGEQGQLSMTSAEVEKLYNLSNEYKANHENK